MTLIEKGAFKLDSTNEFLRINPNAESLRPSQMSCLQFAKDVDDCIYKYKAFESEIASRGSIALLQNLKCK